MNLKTVALGTVAPGQRARVEAVHSENVALTARLLTLGCTRGRDIRVVHRALLGGTLAIEVLGSTVALRRSEAAALDVLLVEEPAQEGHPS